MKNIAVLVLAAGKSSRMKSIKQLEKINKKTLLDITLEKAKSISLDSVFCVLGANSNKIKQNILSKNIRFVINTNFENGLSSSIISGINFFKENNLNFDAVFILLADQPAIEITYLQSMLNLFYKNESNIIASNYGNKLGVPVIFPNNYFANLLLIKGDKGAKVFLAEHKTEVKSLNFKSNFIDIDTKEDLQMYKESILK